MMLSRGVGTRPQRRERQKPWAPLVKQPTVAGSNRAHSASRKCCLAVRAIVHFFNGVWGSNTLEVDLWAWPNRLTVVDFPPSRKQASVEPRYWMGV